MSADMDQALKRAVAAYKAMPPVDKALHDAAQRRSHVRGMSGRDPGPDVLAEEVIRLRALLAASEARVKELEKGLRLARMNAEGIRLAPERRHTIKVLDALLTPDKSGDVVPSEGES